MLDFRYLSAFLAVAESGSFTAAGKKLHVATSAVSRQIQLFEESCGAQLFFRTPREASLTPVGKRLVEEALRFREASDRALDGNRGGRLRLG
jgi:DNA-binding transcriptional LysR family regulator